MGPRPDGRGRLAAWGGRRGRSCVNGAAAGWPRKAHTDCQGDCDNDASMGPRPDGRGRRRARGATRRACGVNGAAAGWPRKATSQACTRRRGPRVNGAAAGWPRKVFSHDFCAARVRLRQWGRGRMAAEGAVAARARRQAIMRQWGRGRMAAEGGIATLTSVGENASMGPRPDGRGRLMYQACLLRYATASMGPRPDGRGRYVPYFILSFLWLRQWGRGRMAAEGGGLRRAPRAAPLRQWGRSRMAAEGPPSGGSARRRPLRVNGAAAGWPRKVPLSANC